jgi:hypothetical protein
VLTEDDVAGAAAPAGPVHHRQQRTYAHCLRRSEQFLLREQRAECSVELLGRLLSLTDQSDYTNARCSSERKPNPATRLEQLL